MPRTAVTRSLRTRFFSSGLACLLMLFCAGAYGDSAQSSLRDPTRPFHYTAGKSQTADRQQHQFKLESILYGPGRRIAVIDGHAVSRGESVYGARVVKIEPARVILEYKGRRHILHWRRLVQVKQ